MKSEVHICLVCSQFCNKMDSLNLCGEKVLYVGSSIAHHCNFVTLKRETGALVKTCKAYGSVWDPHMFFPGRNFFQVVEREVALNRPSVVILQSSSVDITVLKEKRLTWDRMVQAAKKSSSDIYTLALKLSTDPLIKRIILSERTPRIDSARNTHLTELANEELHRLHSRPSQICTKIHIGKHNLQCSTRAQKAAIFGIYGIGERYDGWHLYGPEGPRQYTASVLNILHKAGVALKSFSPASLVPEVEENENVESSHETVSSGGVQGSTNVEGSHEAVSSGGVQGSTNVEGSHETVSSGGVQGSGRGLAVMPPSDMSGKLSSCSALPVSSSSSKSSSTNSADTFVSQSTTAVSLSAKSCASVLAKKAAPQESASRLRGGAFSENLESAGSKTEAASDTTKRPSTEAASYSTKRPVVRSSSSMSSVSKSTAVSVSDESFASVLFAKRDSVKLMIDTAIKVGKYYGLNLKAGIPNLASGDCAIETTLDQLDKRPEFDGHHLPGDPQFYREKWFLEIERDAWGTSWSARWSDSPSKWKSGWEFMRQKGVYEHELGDIVMHGIAHCNSVDILIINTLEKQGLPYCVIPARALCGRQATTEVPIILAYNEVHYEGLLPVSKVDIQKSIEVKQQFLRSVKKDQISKNPCKIWGPNGHFSWN